MNDSFRSLQTLHRGSATILVITSYDKYAKPMQMIRLREGHRNV